MGLHTQPVGDRDVDVRSTYSVKMQSELRFLCGAKGTRTPDPHTASIAGPVRVVSARAWWSCSPARFSPGMSGACRGVLERLGPTVAHWPARCATTLTVSVGAAWTTDAARRSDRSIQR